MFLIGSPGREDGNLSQGAAEAPQRGLSRLLPSQATGYSRWLVVASHVVQPYGPVLISTATNGRTVAASARSFTCPPTNHQRCEVA